MDAEQFKQRFLPYHRKLYCVAFRLLENTSDAEDLLQEAYLKLWDKREGLLQVGNPEAFCVAMVRNMCLDQLRSGKYACRRESVELTEADVPVAADSVELRDEVRQVRQIIGRLPRNQQQVVTLHDVRGCTYEEIELITGLQPTNIRVLLSRARKKIREEFTKWSNYDSRGF